MNETEELLRTAIEASTAAGAIVAKRFRHVSSVRFKSRANPVTDLDIQAERTIVEVITKRFPGHNILSEEVHTVDRGSEYTWVIDPLDGTVNLTQSIPLVAVSVGLSQDGKPLLGVVFDPMRKELFTAVRGGGAFLNGKQIRASTKASLEDAVVGLDLGYDQSARHRALETILAILPRIQSYRIIGSAVLGLCYVACRRFDLYFHPAIYPWDIAAGSVIASEAGALATDLRGNPVAIDTETIVVSNSELHSQFMDLAAFRLITA